MAAILVPIFENVAPMNRLTPIAASAAEPDPVESPDAEPVSLPTTRPEPNASTDLLILSDGTVYARNLTPELAAVLATLNPHDATLARRASITFPPP